MAERFFHSSTLNAVGNPGVNIGKVAQVTTNKRNPNGHPRPNRQRRRRGKMEKYPSTDSSISNPLVCSTSTKATTPEQDHSDWLTPDPWLNTTDQQKKISKDKMPIANQPQKTGMAQHQGQKNPQKGVPVLDYRGQDVRFREEGPPRTKEQLKRLKELHDSTWDALDDYGNKVKDVDLTNIHHLADWDGNLAPPPVEWDCRGTFRAGQSEVDIQIYVNTTNGFTDQVLEHFQKLILSDLDGKSDIAIPTWKPLAPGAWDDCLKFCQLMSTEEEDCTPIVPFWKHFRTGWEHLMEPLEHPHIAGIDPDESDLERKARENDRGSQGQIDKMLQQEHEKQETERRRKVEKQQQRERERIAAAQAAATAPPPSSFDNIFAATYHIKVDSKIFLRAARDADIPEIRDIYNHYVTNTYAVPESNDLTNPQMMMWMHKIKEANLPFIVACEKGQVIRGRKKVASDPVVLPDRVIGFAFASPSPNTFPNDIHQKPSYCPRTAYLHFFTKSADSMKGVGSCLLDKLLDVLDKFYSPRGGYNVRGEEVNGVGIKIMRIKDLYIRFLHADDKKLPWISRWLQSEYVGFRKVDLVKGVGVKNDLSVNEAIFHRETGEPFAAYELL